MLSSVAVGIDLGTTNSAIAYVHANGKPEIIPNRDGERTTPSVVLYEDGAFVVGASAKSGLSDDPLTRAQFIKRQMGNADYRFMPDGDRTFTPEEVSAMILRRLKEGAEAALGVPVTEAVITVPAYFTDAQRKATQDAGAIAGLKVLRIINEPTAAALAYGTGRSGRETVAVYDLGGGTFDVTIMRLEEGDLTVLAVGGDRNLGGFDFDNLIMNRVQEEFQVRHGLDLYDDPAVTQELREKAEAVKRQLSSRPKADLRIAAGGHSLALTVRREEFEEMLQPLLRRTGHIMQMVADEAGVTWEQVDKVLLVGGSTRVPAVSRLVETVTGHTPSGELNPDEVVALGAAIQADLLKSAGDGEGNLEHLVRVRDVNAHGLGIVALNGDRRENTVMLPKNSPLPCQASRTFFTTADYQTTLRVEVTEGEDEDLQYVRIIGTGELTIPPHPANSPVEFTVRYDTSGIVHVSARDLVVNRGLGQLVFQRRANMNPETVERKSREFSDLDIE